MFDEILATLGAFLLYSWWFWVLIIFAPLAADTWLAWRQKMFEHRIKWSLLEILIPREVLRSPQAMEQVFTQIASFKNYPGNIKEYWWDGEVTLWYSFELVSLGGEVHFYMRVPTVYRDLVEAAIFAFYPDIELVETEDYINTHLPKTIPEMYRDGKEMWGTELILDKSGAYPLRSYKDFESPDENKEYDPMSSFIELLGKVGPGQVVAIQYLIMAAASPHDKHMIDEYHEEVIKLRERKNEGGHDHGSASLKAQFPGGVMPHLEVTGAHEEAEEAGLLKKAVLSRTPGETAVIEAIEENLSRPIFRTTIRYIYISPKETYSEDFPNRAVYAAFRQYGASDLNNLGKSAPSTTKTKLWEYPFLFPDVRKDLRRQRLLLDYRHREMPPHTKMGRIVFSSIFNFYKHDTMHLSTRSLASLYHPPTTKVLTGPHIKRVDSRKGGAPSGMAIFGDESQIDRFK